MVNVLFAKRKSDYTRGVQCLQFRTVQCRRPPHSARPRLLPHNRGVAHSTNVRGLVTIGWPGHTTQDTDHTHTHIRERAGVSLVTHPILAPFYIVFRAVRPPAAQRAESGLGWNPPLAIAPRVLGSPPLMIVRCLFESRRLGTSASSDANFRRLRVRCMP